MKKILHFITFLLVTTCFQLTAQTVTWDGGAGTTTWSDAANWDGDAVPTSSDDVYIDDATVVLTASTTIQRVYLNGTSNLTINSSQTLTITDFAGSDDGLELNNSAVLINNGTIAISNIHIADTNADGIYNRGTITNNGAITIDGTGQYGIYMQRGTFTNSASGTLTIANYGQGDTAADGLYLDDSSGTISTFNNIGSVTITMPGSDDGIMINDSCIFNNTGMLTVGGSAGDNGIRIDNSGVFNNNSGGTFTINSTPDDQLFLDDDGAFNNTGTVNLNNAADVGLYVTDEGVFTNNSGGNVNISSPSNFSIQVDANSSTANISNFGTITTTGGSQDGLRLQESGAFTNNSGGSLVINQPTGEGIRFTADAGTLTNSGTITITGSGSGVAPGDNGIEVSGGTLTNASGATLTITNIFDKGILTTGGTINNNGTIDISNTGEEGMDMNTGGTFNNNNGGIFKVLDGTADALEINTGCTVINDGDMQLTFTTDGSGRDDIEFNGGTFTNTSNATFNPGNSGTYGELEFRGNIELGESTTTFDISGTTHTTEFDRIDFPSSGFTIFLTGAKAHLNWGSYVPNVGDTFKIVDGSATVDGNFSSVTTSNSDIVTTLNYSANEVQVEVTDVNNTWTGTTDTAWGTATNWSTGVPTSSMDVTIPSGLSNYPTVTTAETVNSLTIASGATLVATNAGFTVTNNASYTRNLATGSQWYLMSSPVNGETFNDDWVTTNSIASGSSFTTNRGISEYDNSSFTTPNVAGSAGHWRYMQGAGSGTFMTGEGYGIIRSSAGNIEFIGSGIYSSNQNYTLEQGGNNFNLIGNPFTAFITLGTFYTTNSANIGTDFYFWNGSSYDTRTSGLNSSFEIAPGQGFFVEANNTNNVTFEISDASHQGTDTFQKSARPEVTLNITEGNNTRYAKVFYIDGTTKGYDNGYDGKLFGGVSHAFALYSDLLESDGNKYQLQSLPNSDHENMVVPIGVIAEAGKEITFTAEALNLPSGLMVFLEDRELNTITRLDEVNSNYKITLNNALNGTGRFYLHTASSALSINDITLEGVNVFALNRNTLRINGINSDKASVKLFNILGKNVLSSSFSSKGVSEVNLPNLSSGVYIVQLITEKGKTSKKIVLE